MTSASCCCCLGPLCQVAIRNCSSNIFSHTGQQVSCPQISVEPYLDRCGTVSSWRDTEVRWLIRPGTRSKDRPCPTWNILRQAYFLSCRGRSPEVLVITFSVTGPILSKASSLPKALASQASATQTATDHFASHAAAAVAVAGELRRTIEE